MDEKKDGFNLKSTTEDSDLTVAFISLRVALKSYFSTYYVLRSVFTTDIFQIIKISQENSYIETYAETIVHLQHFFELIIKDILKVECGCSDTDLKFTNISSLIKRDDFKSIGYINQHRKPISELNKFRNRIWHKGSFVLYYHRLDKFIGNEILPVIESITGRNRYKEFDDIWHHKQPHCDVNPLKNIRAEGQKKCLSVGKIALLKEIGRASYNIPFKEDLNKYKKKATAEKIALEMKFTEEEITDHIKQKITMLKYSKEQFRLNMANFLCKDMIQNAEEYTRMLAQTEMATPDIETCPVCGIKTLSLFYDYTYLEDDEGRSALEYHNIKAAKCNFCTFEINTQLKLNKYSISGINYWK